MVESRLNYLAAMDERPSYYLYEPPAGTPWRNTTGDRRTLQIHDARALEPRPTLDREGFTMVRHRTAVEDMYSGDEVVAGYYPEVERLVEEATGATRVLVFDHNVRNAARAGHGEDGAQNPVRFVHCDYTASSGPQRVRDLIATDEVEDLLRSRFAVINVWKPISGPVEEAPLAVCDAQSIAPEDLLETDLRYRGRTGEVYSFLYNEAHRWYYYPRMRSDEVLLLKCFDSDPERARFTAHTAFDDPTSPPDAGPRESIEVRSLAFFEQPS